MVSVRGHGRDLGHPLSAHQGRGRRGLGAGAGLHPGRARLAAAAAGGHPRRPPARAEGARPMAGRVYRDGDRGAVRAAVQRRTPPAQLDQRPAGRGGPDLQRAAGLAHQGRRPADAAAVGRAGHRPGRGGPAGRAERGPGRPAAGHRGAAGRARLLDRPADRQPQAVAPAAGRGQRGLPGHGRAGLRPVRRAHLPHAGAVGPGLGGPGRARGDLHGGRVPGLLPADRRGRPGPRHRHHLRQPRGRGRARRPGPGRAPDRHDRRLLRPHPGRLGARHPPLHAGSPAGGGGGATTVRSD